MGELQAIERKLERLSKDFERIGNGFADLQNEAEKKKLELHHLQQRLELSLEIARGENGGEAVSKLQMCVLKSNQRRGITPKPKDK